MQEEVPEDASGLATAHSFGRAGAKSAPCEELGTSTSTVLRTKCSDALFAVERSHGAREVGVIPLAIFLVARAGSGPAVRNIVDRQDGREDQGRAPRRGRRGLCRWDSPGAARDSPAHIRVQLRAQSGSAASSTPASVSWKRMEAWALITRTRRAG